MKHQVVSRENGEDLWVVSVEFYDFVVPDDVSGISHLQIILIFDILMEEISYPAS